MVQTTRTLNPLPFEALEPRRFEDLVRQLAYDFRIWHALEATGRAGSNDGFDARGWEVVRDQDAVEREDSEDDQETESPLQTSRKWLIQCKRERVIGPTKIAKYVNDIDPEEAKELYGIVFAAACDLSKKTRDTFREKCRDLGIAEIYMWGKGEIEDMLFQPKNDGLLFAYFGISLRIQQRSVKTAIRSRLSMKKKVNRLLGKGTSNYTIVPLRDPNENDYPYIPDGMTRYTCKWEVAIFEGHYVNAIKIHMRRLTAYLDMDGEHWEIANIYSDHINLWSNPWVTEEERETLEALNREIFQFKATLPQGPAGMFDMHGLINYEDIIEFDDEGDEFFEHPHIYINFDKNGPVLSEYVAELSVPPKMIEVDGKFQEAEQRRVLWNPQNEKQTMIFPDKFRKPRRT